jgi:hypothetical protein
MRLILDNGIFYEFVPVEELETPAPTRHWLGTVQPGVTYALAVSSCAGLWAYVVGDTVRFVGLDPPRILVAGRTSYFLSAFGEHLSGEEIEAAVAAAARSVGCTIADFSVGPVFPDAARRLGRHLYVVEFGERSPSDQQLHAFALALDARLCHDNDDYRAHRSGGFGLDAPEVLRVPHGTFAAWMRGRGQLGGQHKVPRVVADPALIRQLRDFAGTLR